MLSDYFNEALDCFEKVIELDSKDPDGHYGKGLVYYYTGDKTKARVWYNKAIQYGPEKNFRSYDPVPIKTILRRIEVVFLLVVVIVIVLAVRAI